MQWMMLQQDTPDDFVIATGVQHSVRQFLLWTAQEMGITMEFQGEGVDEVAVVANIVGDAAPALKVGDIILRIDPRYFRPAEVETLLGDPAKARKLLGWNAEVSAQDMCIEMVRNDLKEARKARLLLDSGYEREMARGE